MSRAPDTHRLLSLAGGRSLEQPRLWTFAPVSFPFQGPTLYPLRMRIAPQIARFEITLETVRPAVMRRIITGPWRAVPEAVVTIRDDWMPARAAEARKQLARNYR